MPDQADPSTSSTPQRTSAARGRGPLIAAASVAVVVLAALGVALFVWANVSGHGTAGGGSGSVDSASAFASAMKKAGTRAPSIPTTPTPITDVKAAGHHSFEATFTYDELGAVLGAFTYEANAGGTRVSLSNTSLSPDGNGGITLRGKVIAGNTSYSGKASGQVVFHRGVIDNATPLDISAEGIGLSGAQAQQATLVLLGYVNGYLHAAPGLTITSARVASDGVRVTGMAPDSITWASAKP